MNQIPQFCCFIFKLLPLFKNMCVCLPTTTMISQQDIPMAFHPVCNQQLSSWTKGPLNRKFMLGTVNLTHYPWLVRYWTLERNLSPPLCQTKITFNCILNTYHIHRCISHLLAKKCLFADDTDNYGNLQLVKMQTATEFGMPNPS